MVSQEDLQRRDIEALSGRQRGVAQVVFGHQVHCVRQVAELHVEIQQPNLARAQFASEADGQVGRDGDLAGTTLGRQHDNDLAAPSTFVGHDGALTATHCSVTGPVECVDEFLVRDVGCHDVAGTGAHSTDDELGPHVANHHDRSTGTLTSKRFHPGQPNVFVDPWSNDHYQRRVRDDLFGHLIRRVGGPALLPGPRVRGPERFETFVKRSERG